LYQLHRRVRLHQRGVRDLIIPSLRDLQGKHTDYGIAYLAVNRHFAGSNVCVDDTYAIKYAGGKLYDVYRSDTGFVGSLDFVESEGRIYFEFFPTREAYYGSVR